MNKSGIKPAHLYLTKVCFTSLLSLHFIALLLHIYVECLEDGNLVIGTVK